MNRVRDVLVKSTTLGIPRLTRHPVPSLAIAVTHYPA